MASLINFSTMSTSYVPCLTKKDLIEFSIEQMCISYLSFPSLVERQYFA